MKKYKGKQMKYIQSHCQKYGIIVNLHSTMAGTDYLILRFKKSIYGSFPYVYMVLYMGQWHVQSLTNNDTLNLKQIEKLVFQLQSASHVIRYLNNIENGII